MWGGPTRKDGRTASEVLIYPTSILLAYQVKRMVFVTPEGAKAMTTVTSLTPKAGIPQHHVLSIHAASEPIKADLPHTPAPKAAPPRATPSAIEIALRSIISEVTPGTRPFSTDSSLPAHLVDTARAALAGDSPAAHQHAHNALSTAAWHIARGEAPQALARLRRARSYILASMEGACNV
jgi:hypothetical protein